MPEGVRFCSMKLRRSRYGFFHSSSSIDGFELLTKLRVDASARRRLRGCRSIDKTSWGPMECCEQSVRKIEILAQPLTDSHEADLSTELTSNFSSDTSCVRQAHWRSTADTFIAAETIARLSRSFIHSMEVWIESHRAPEDDGLRR